jgi:maltose O-acetyltransferase
MRSIKLLLAGFLNYLWNGFITHIPWHGFRKFFLRLLNQKISRSCVILMHTRILDFWKVEIGDRVVINQYCLLDCRKFKIQIASDTDIGPYVKIWTLGHDPDSDNHEVMGGDVVIEDHVWVASNVTILSNLQVGRGAVIASSSTVTKSIPALEIWGGSPAKKIRLRKNSLTYQLNYTPYFE